MCARRLGFSLLSAISKGEPLNIIGPLDRGSPRSASEIRRHERPWEVVGGLPLWRVIAYVAGVLGRCRPVAATLKRRLQQTPISDRTGAAASVRVTIMLSDPRTDFDLSRTNAVRHRPTQHNRAFNIQPVMLNST